MKRAPDWTLDEFEILLNSPTLPDENLDLKLPKRIIGAIQNVRNGIHAYHTGNNYSMLSKMLVSRLEKSPSELICPIYDKPNRVELDNE
jgi:hypothetical protein